MQRFRSHVLIAVAAAIAAACTAASDAPAPASTTPAAGSAEASPYKNPIALQLYSFREAFKADGVPATLARIKEMGFTHVELAGSYDLTPEAFKAELDKAGLTPISMHVDVHKLGGDESASVIAEAKTYGVRYIGNAWFPHEGSFDQEDAQNAIKAFNAAGQKAADAGMQFFYHAHGFEFVPAGDGGTLFDTIVAATDPDRVKFELDIFWAHHGGADPVALLKKYPTRFVLTHMKDMKHGTPHGTDGRAPADSSVALGTGEVDVKGVVEAARGTSVEWHIIEEESSDPGRNVPAGLAYLQSLAKGPRS